MPLEEPLLFVKAGVEFAAREPGHDFEQNRDVIFRLPRRARALDAEPIQIFADARQWAFMKKAGEIIRRIGKQLAAAEPDEQIEELLADAILECRRSACKFDM